MCGTASSGANNMKQGFALVVVLLMLSVALIASMQVWRSTFLFRQYTHERVQAVKQDMLCMSIMRYAIAFCKENWDRLNKQVKKGKQKEIISFAVWGPQKNKPHGALITLDLDHDRHTVTASLMHDNQVRKSLQLLIYKTVDGIQLAQLEKK